MDGGAILDRLDKGPEFRFSGPCFETIDQIRAAALEEAAKVCDEEAVHWRKQETLYRTRDNNQESAHNCAIRADVLEDFVEKLRALKEAR
jgi:LmbE family N-acetylglucosaminyl deacetylase